MSKLLHPHHADEVKAIAIPWVFSENAKLNKRAKMALDRSPDFLRLLWPFFFCFQRRIYKNFFMSVQCKKPPFTNTMFIDRSKFQKQF